MIIFKWVVKAAQKHQNRKVAAEEWRHHDEIGMHRFLYLATSSNQSN